MALYKLPLVFEPQEEGGFMVTCPLIPELVTEGETVPEGIRNAQDALEAVLEIYQDLGRPLPGGLQPSREDAPIWLEAAMMVNDLPRRHA